MRKRTAMGILLAALLVVVLVVAACGGGGTTTTSAITGTTAGGTGASTGGGAATGEPIKLGLLMSLTGVSAAPCANVVNAVKLEVDAINAAGGVNGRPIELVVEDDKSDVTAATAAMTKLIQQDKVTAIMGPFPMWCAAPSAAIASKAEVP
ncbi:MAG: ABC transporter substrate-binding protein, partial [Thermoleophilia bacterium]|nr:ABC transporter substrate-binding protein [Thermoleophilia bacterium]